MNPVRPGLAASALDAYTWSQPGGRTAASAEAFANLFTSGVSQIPSTQKTLALQSGKEQPNVPPDCKAVIFAPPPRDKVASVLAMTPHAAIAPAPVLAATWPADAVAAAFAPPPQDKVVSVLATASHAAIAPTPALVAIGPADAGAAVFALPPRDKVASVLAATPHTAITPTPALAVIGTADAVATLKHSVHDEVSPARSESLQTSTRPEQRNRAIARQTSAGPKVALYDQLGRHVFSFAGLGVFGLTAAHDMSERTMAALPRQDFDDGSSVRHPMLSDSRPDAAAIPQDVDPAGGDPEPTFSDSIAPSAQHATAGADGKADTARELPTLSRPDASPRSALTALFEPEPIAGEEQPPVQTSAGATSTKPDAMKPAPLAVTVAGEDAGLHVVLRSPDADLAQLQDVVERTVAAFGLVVEHLTFNGSVLKGGKYGSRTG